MVSMVVYNDETDDAQIQVNSNHHDCQVFCFEMLY